MEEQAINLVEEIVYEEAAPYEEAVESVSTGLRKAIRWIVYAAALLVPLWFLPFTADVLEFSKQMLVFVLAGVGIVLWLIDMIKSGALQYRRTSFYWPLAGLFIAAIIALIFSVNRFTTLFGLGNSHVMSLVMMFSYLSLFMLAISTMDDRGRMIRQFMTVSFGVTLLLGTLQLLGVKLFGASLGAAFNTVGSVNALAFLGAVLIPFFFIAPETDIRWQSIIVNVFRFVGLISALFLLVVLNWGMLWIAAFISVLGYIAFTSSSQLQRGKMKFFALPMAIIVVGVFLWIINFNWGTIKSKLPVEVAPRHGTSYNIAWKSLKSKPLGYGLENYGVGYDKLRPDSSVNNVLFQAHFTDSTSEFSTMLVEGGFPMLVAFLIFLFFIVRELIREIRNGFETNATRGKLWASLLAVVVLFFLYPMNITVMLTLFFLLALIVLDRDVLEERMVNLEGRNAYSFIGSLAFIVGLVAVLAGGYFLINQFIGNVQFAHALKTKSPDTALNAMVQSINSYPYDARVYRGLTQVLLAQIDSELQGGPKGRSQADYNTQVQNKITSVINVAGRSTEVDPADSENWLNRGYVYQNLINLLAGSDKAALDMYNEAIARNPANALAYVRVGNIHLTLADAARTANNKDETTSHLNQAEEQYQKAISLYNNYGQALYNLAAVYDRKGEVPQAIKQFEKLQGANPRDPSLLFQLGLLYYRNDQKEGALKAWERAVVFFPDYSNAHWYLSLAYEERGDQASLEKALSEAKIVAKLNPDNQMVKDRIDKLEQGLKTFAPPADVLDQTPINNEN